MSKEIIRKVVLMSVRLSVGMLVLVAIWSCARVPGLHDESGGSYIRLPFVRVLLQENSPAVELKPEGTYAVECLTDTNQAVYFVSKTLSVRVVGRTLTVDYGNGKSIGDGLREVNIIPRGQDSRTRFAGKQYRGILKFLPAGQNVQVINVLYIEDYLRGVVPSEIGKRIDEEVEAVKAQAIAARTYAMRHLQQYDGEEYDLKSTVADQLYDGMGVEDNLVNKAIDATAGQVAMFQDAYINAYYHSTCGGMTDDIDQVWDKAESPYLKAVADSGACSWSKYYTWTETFSEPQLRSKIEQYLSADKGREIRIGPITDVIVRDRTAGGRINTLMIRTESDVYRFQKDQIRWATRRASNPDLILPSARFDVDVSRDAAGNVTSITFKGRGYGHGVGMCQCGAIGLSRNGWKVDKILGEYYRGVELKKLY